jgi:VanZ family protein
MNFPRGKLLRATSLLIATLWAALVYYLSDQPSIEITPLFRHQDKLLHLCAYFVLGFFTLGALRADLRGHSPGQFWLVSALCGIYGLLDEYHQSFVPGRDATLADVMADLTGAVLGAGILFLLVRHYATEKTHL